MKLKFNLKLRSILVVQVHALTEALVETMDFNLFIVSVQYIIREEDVKLWLNFNFSRIHALITRVLMVVTVLIMVESMNVHVQLLILVTNAKL